MKLRHFSIRDLLWLTVVVALVIGWWTDHRRNDRETKVIDFQGNEALVTERAAPGVYYIWCVNQQYSMSPNEVDAWRQKWKIKADASVTPPPPTIP